jgi:threonine/homoserine/homoserine lactone efflux protein
VVHAVPVPFACAGVMAVVLLVARGFITQQQPTWAGLVAQVGIGALVYMGTALLLDAQLRTKAVQLFKTERARQ